MTATSITQLKQQLTKSLDSVETCKAISSRNTPNTAFAFAGQGSMYIGAGKELYQTCPDFASEIHHLDEICQLHGFPGFIGVVEGTLAVEEMTPIVTSLAIVCVEMALGSLWKLFGVEPSVVIGHSLGEFAALHVAGVLSASDTIFLVGKRAELVSRSCEAYSHSMLAVRAVEDDLANCLHGIDIETACKNSTNENVLAGSKHAIATAREALEAEGHKCHELDVPFAFHSAQMDAILDEFEKIATQVVFHSPSIPVISPVRSTVIFDGKSFNATYFRDATRNPVEFVAALDAAESMQLVDGNTAWLDIGAHPICSSFIRNTKRAAAINIVGSLSRKESNWATLAASCAALHSAGVLIDWSEYHKPYDMSHRLLDLPKYSWNNKNYWIQYNGTWALTKGNSSSEVQKTEVAASPISTSSVHRVLEHSFESPWEGTITVESDVVRADFLEAAWGHKMNNCAVVTSVSLSEFSLLHALILPVHPCRHCLHSRPIHAQPTHPLDPLCHVHQKSLRSSRSHRQQ